MAKYRIAWMPGDGIGNDVMEAARIVLDRLKLDAEYVPCDIGWEFWCKEGNALPDRTVKALKETTCGLFGAITSKPQDEAKEELSAGTEGQRPRLLFADRGAAADVQPAHEHAAMQELSRQPAELSRQQDHESERRRRADRSGRVPRKHRRACTAASSFSRLPEPVYTALCANPKMKQWKDKAAWKTSRSPLAS